MSRISLQHRQDAMETLDKLLGRLIKQVPFPLENDLATIWEKSLPREYRKACDTIRTYCKEVGAAPPLETSVAIHLPVDFGSHLYLVQLYGNKFVKYHHARPVPVEFLGLAPEDAKTFQDWCEQTAAIGRKIDEAWWTIDRLFSMASTAGQLKRMAPDLLRYLPENLQRAANMQDRRSRLPPEWTTFPRGNVHNMVTLVATCYMLDPKVLYPHGEKQYSHEDYRHITWAKCVAPDPGPVRVGQWAAMWHRHEMNN